MSLNWLVRKAMRGNAPLRDLDALGLPAEAMLNVVSGRIVACDPFLGLHEDRGPG